MPSRIFTLYMQALVERERERERELVSLLSITYNFVVSIRRSLLSLLVLGKRGVILLWHFLGLPCYCFGTALPDRFS